MPESQQPSCTPKQQEATSDGPGTKEPVKRTAMGLNQRFVDTLGWIITAVWALSMALHASNIGYEPPASIHLLMMVVAGTAFGTNFIKPKNGDTDGDG